MYRGREGGMREREGKEGWNGVRKEREGGRTSERGGKEGVRKERKREEGWPSGESLVTAPPKSIQY